MAALKRIRVEVISDVACPWCFVGKRRLEEAIRRMDPSKYAFEVKFRPFLLDPSMTFEPDRQAMYARKFGGMGGRFAQIQQMLLQIGADCGIRFNWTGPIGPSREAHRLIAYADKHGKQLEVVEAFFSAHHEQSKNIADEQLLVQIGENAGLPGVREFLRTDELKSEVMDDIQKAQARGVRGVPHFIINGRLSLSGAQEPDVLTRAFEQA